MNRKRITYHLPILILIIGVGMLHLSFSTRLANSVLPETNLISVYKTLCSTHPESYNPDLSEKADSVIIPLKRSGNLFLIDATVDGEHGNMVFDTGSNGLVLNSTYFRNHVKTGGVQSNGITGSVGLVEQIKVESLEFADLKYKNLTADLTNLGHIENRRKVKIIGLIGFGMMRNLEIVIDPENSELKLFRIDKSGHRTSSNTQIFRPEFTQKMEVNGNIVFVEGVIAGKNLKFCFDTGAETNTINSYSNKKVLNTITITRRTALKGAGAASSEVLFGRMNDFTFGTRQIKNMETIITDLDALSSAYGTDINGMLGYSFLKHGTVCINFVKKEFGIRFMKGEEK